MLYNSSGERAKREVDGQQRWYCRDGYEIDDSGQTTQSITLNGMPVATVEGSGKIWPQITDYQGTPVYSRSSVGETQIRHTTPFGSPDTVTPGSFLHWNRYAYVDNSPEAEASEPCLKKVVERSCGRALLRGLG